MKNKVFFLEHKPNPLDYYSAIDAFASVSREDSFPLVCLESASFAKPILCFEKAGGMAEFVENDCGFVVPFLDTGRFADKILELCENPESHKNARRKCRKKSARKSRHRDFRAEDFGNNRTILELNFLTLQRLYILRLCADRKNFYQNQTRDKSADMRCVSHAARSRRCQITEQNLVADPKSERDIRRNGRYHSEDQGANFSGRKQKHITAENARNRTGRAEHRDYRIGSHYDLRERGGDSADDVKSDVANMPDQIFDVVAENPQKQHIAEDVHYIAVHKHRTQKIKINRQRRILMHNGRRLSADLDRLCTDKINARSYFLRHERKSISKRIVAAQALKKNKHQNIQTDNDVIDIRRNYSIGIVVA